MIRKLKQLSVVFFLLSSAGAYAHSYAEEMLYVCKVSLFYITYTTDECIAEQEDFYNRAKAITPPHLWKRTMWYGYRYNWKGEVVGIDFYKVHKRARYVKKETK